MGDGGRGILRAVLVLVFIGLLSFFVYLCGYKIGQIDAIRGTIKYELIEQMNGELRWERIKVED